MYSHGCPENHDDSDYINDIDATTLWGVRCCASASDSTYCCSCPDCTPNDLIRNCHFNCHQSKTANEATSICLAKGMRLCYPYELNSCCGTGCKLNGRPVWVLGKMAY